MTPEQNKAYISAANDVRAAKGQKPLTPAQETEVLAKLAAKQATRGIKTTGSGAPIIPYRPLAFLGWPFTEIGLGTLALVAGGAVGTYYLYQATKKPKPNPRFFPDRLTFNMMRQAAYDAKHYPGLDPAARSYPGPARPAGEHYQGRGEAPFDDSDYPE